jgi:hypothetical protein
MKRTDVINTLIDTYNYKTYLEVGTQDPNSNFNSIKAEHKESIDPFPRGEVTFVGTSDEYFDSITEDKKFDIIFIDGLHTREQCLRDILNSLNHLTDNGSILVHDCLPTAEYQTTNEDNGREWTGDVWKSIVDIQLKNDVEVCTIDTDWGIGFIRKKVTDKPNPQLELIDLDWATYESMRNQLLNVKTIEQWINSL